MRKLAALLVVPALAFASFAADRGPSTPAERKKIVENARYLEKNPLAPDAKERRNWTLNLLLALPDIEVHQCYLPTDEFANKPTEKHAPEVATQALISSAAYMIQNPSKAKNELAVQKAGVLGRLSAYEAILQQDPNAHWPSLDDLLKKRGTAEFDKYIQTLVDDCSKGMKVQYQKK